MTDKEKGLFLLEKYRDIPGLDGMNVPRWLISEAYIGRVEIYGHSGLINSIRIFQAGHHISTIESSIVVYYWLLGDR